MPDKGRIFFVVVFYNAIVLVSNLVQTFCDIHCIFRVNNMYHNIYINTIEGRPVYSPLTFCVNHIGVVNKQVLSYIL
jgi:hypothetical protein